MADSSDYKNIMKQGKLVGKTTFVSDKSLLNEPAVTLSFTETSYLSFKIPRWQ